MYVKNSRRLLRESAESVNPFQGMTPEVWILPNESFFPLFVSVLQRDEASQIISNFTALCARRFLMV